MILYKFSSKYAKVIVAYIGAALVPIAFPSKSYVDIIYAIKLKRVIVQD